MESESRTVIAGAGRIPWRAWRPRLADALATYDRRTFAADLVAGVTVGVVALPLAMTFGIASGVTPQAGIYAAIVGGFWCRCSVDREFRLAVPPANSSSSPPGSSRRTASLGLLMVTMMAGVLLVLHAVTGLVQAVRFIPRPVVLGFTNGIALLTASTQIKDLLGLRIADSPSEFFARMAVLGASIDT